MYHQFSLPTLKIPVSFLLLALVFGSCQTQDPITPVTDHSFDPVSFDFLTLGVPDLKDIDIRLRQGIPVYDDTKQLLETVQAIAMSTDEEYLSWLNATGFGSVKSKYLEIVDLYERQGDENPTFKIPSEVEDFLFLDDEIGPYLNPTLPFPELTNTDGYLFVGDDLHQFTFERHLIIDQGTLADMEILHAGGTLDKKSVVNVLEEISMGDPSNEILTDPGKVKNRILQCPKYMGGNVEGNYTTQSAFSNAIGLNTSESPGIEYQLYLKDTDVQRVDCNRRRCRQHTHGYLFGRSLLTEINGTHYTETVMFRYLFENRKRNGAQRTWPDVIIEPQPYNPLMNIRFETSYRLTNGDTEVINSSNTAPVNLPPSVFRGVSARSWILNTVLREIPYNHPSVHTLRSRLFIDGGAVGHRWTNRGNNPIHDPISVYFICL